MTGGAGIERLQLLQQAGDRLGLRLALGAHARPSPLDQLDVDERAQVVDDDDHRPRVRRRGSTVARSTSGGRSCSVSDCPLSG